MFNFEGKTILITGATGFIGSNIIFNLMKTKKINIIAISKNKKNFSRIFSKFKNHKNFIPILQDISLPFYKMKKNIDYIFHAASSQEAKIIKKTPVDVILPNILGTISCLDYLKKNKKTRLVFFSSVTVYGNNTNKDLNVSEADTFITDALDSNNAAYSQSKRMAEVIINSYVRQFNIDAVICRLSTVYGPTHYKINNGFFEFINNAILSKNIVMKFSTLPKRDNIYIEDAISGIFFAALKGKSGETYNVSSNGQLGNFLALNEIAEEIKKIYNSNYSKFSRKIKLATHKKKFNQVKFGVKLNNSKLKKLGWRISTSMREGIKKTFDFYKLN
jgi:nucleoside-diphosphate-sugar epimerase